MTRQSARRARSSNLNVLENKEDLGQGRALDDRAPVVGPTRDARTDSPGDRAPQARCASSEPEFAAGACRMEVVPQHQHVYKVTDRPSKLGPASTEHRRDNRRVFLIRIPVQQDFKRSQTNDIRRRAFPLRKALEPFHQGCFDMERVPAISARLDRGLGPVIQHVIVRQFAGQSRSSNTAPDVGLLHFPAGIVAKRRNHCRERARVRSPLARPAILARPDAYCRLRSSISWVIDQPSTAI